MAGQSTPQETAARKILRAMGLQVEAVSWVHRGDDEFAAVVVFNGATHPEVRSAADRQYERALEVLTDPRCPLRVVREHVGRDDIRIYVAFAAPAGK